MAKRKQSSSKKECFLVTPIGEPSSLIRQRVDQWMQHIYKPALSKKFKLIRADMIAAPGRITQQILDRLINAELVVIDLTDLNPNVMYEAAIRHAAAKPWIQIIPANERIPFDIHDFRAIRYDPTDIDYPQKLKKELVRAVKDINSATYHVPSLVEYHFDFHKIFADPERFVELMKSHFTSVTDKSPASSVVKMFDNNLGKGVGGVLYPRTVSCPKCGVVAASFLETSSPAINLFSFNKSQYKCENCGTEFLA